MRFISIIKLFFFIFIYVIFNACNQDDLSKITAIELKVNRSELPAGQPFEFNVFANNSTDVTQIATIKVNEIEITGTEFLTFEPGTYTASASFDNFESNTINLTVVNQGLLKRVLVEDYTGTWCGFCPRVSYAIEQAKLQSDNIVSVAIHLDNNDPYITPEGDMLADEFNISGLPKGRLNRIHNWSSPQQDNITEVNDLIGFDASLGLTIDSSLDNNVIIATISVGFVETFTEPLNLVVYLVENGLIYNQTNYTADLYSAGYENPLVNFEHKDVLRAMFTSHLGTNIPSSETIENNVFTFQLQEEVPSNVTDTGEIHLVAFVVDVSSQEAINSRESIIGESQVFE